MRLSRDQKRALEVLGRYGDTTDQELAQEADLYAPSATMRALIRKGLAELGPYKRDDGWSYRLPEDRS